MYPSRRARPVQQYDNLLQGTYLLLACCIMMVCDSAPDFSAWAHVLHGGRKRCRVESEGLESEHRKAQGPDPAGTVGPPPKGPPRSC